MTIVNRTKTLILTALTLYAVSNVGYAQQWNGSANDKGNIWRPGTVTVGGEPISGEEKAVLDVKRALIVGTSQDDLLFRANVAYKDSFFRPFEVDGRRAYAGGARSKASILPPDFDFAVHRKAAIGMVNIDQMPRPSDYTLVVGGKILAEEVRIKLIEDWADYVFAKDYPLKSLADLEQFIHAHHRLPKIPSAAEVEEVGVSLGHMQSKMLLKIEDLTLYLIEQNKTIDTLQEKLAQLEQGNKPPQPMDQR